jgi:undecaprenyl-diphosphatase
MKSFMSFVRNLLFILVAVFSGGTLFVIANGVTTGTELTPFNVAIANIIIHLRTPLLTSVMLFFTNIGSPTVLGVLSIFIAVLLFLKRDTFDAFLYLISIMSAILSFVLMKNAFHITRPFGGLVQFDTWSFPSGHATVATAFFFATGYTFLDKIKNIFGKFALIIGCIFGAAVVSFSRVYLGVHFALDILAGTALGILCVSATVLIFNIFIGEEKWRHSRLISKIDRLNR